MTERLAPAGQEVKVGEVFKPFEVITPLSNANDLTRRAEYSFTFEGMEGLIYLLQEDSLVFSDGDSYDYSEHGLATPLGRVRRIEGIGEGEHFTSLEDSPITVYLKFDAHTPNHINTLLSHAVELKIGDRKFYLLPQLETHGDRTMETILEHVKETGYEEVWESVEKDESCKEVFIWLPYAPSKLREIEARIIPRDQMGHDQGSSPA